MMSKVIHFDNSLPRSGGTLLTSLLNQHYDVYAGTQSPVYEIMRLSLNELNMANEMYYNPVATGNVIKNIPHNYYEGVKESIVVDKCRKWCYSIDFIKDNISKNPKIICCVRDPLDILASFIVLIHKYKDTNFVDKRLRELGLDINDTNRCWFFMQEGNGVLEHALNGIKKALSEGHKDCILFIDYNDLIDNTERELEKISSFLNLNTFVFNLNNIQARFRENDMFSYGMPDMHYVKPVISKSSTDYREILSSSIINEYKDLDYWRQ